MPVYEYQCEKCKTIFQVFVTSYKKAKREETCACGQKAKRIISKSSFSLKGSGWAKDGYSG